MFNAKGETSIAAQILFLEMLFFHAVSQNKSRDGDFP